MSHKVKIITIITSVLVALVCVLVTFVRCEGDIEQVEDTEAEQREYIFGIDKGNYTMQEDVVQSGQTLSTILLPYGIGGAVVEKIIKKSEGILNIRNLRAGQPYTMFCSGEDTTKRLCHFVYEQSLTDFWVISLEGDSVEVRLEQKPVHIERRKGTATIKSSLWNAMVESNMPASLAMELSEVYAWSVDFFGLQEGDHFTVVYDQKYVDTTSLGTGRIWGAIFNHNGKDYYAIPFKQGDKVTYWDENGNSLRKTLLKSPLKFSRISSRFSNGRLHPVLKIVRPHHGVDYAAPSGTPVNSVADGTVIYKGYSGGGGNTLKIKHSSGFTSGYLHLRGFAKGIAVGKRVSQGQLIGYVGSTGLSTGPHLDFRLWSGNKAIDPLKVPSTPTEPISKANKVHFDWVKERVLGELAGDVAEDKKLVQFDSIQRQ